MGSINVERKGLVATVTINNPNRRNAMTLSMWKQIPGVFEQIAKDSLIKAVVLRGAGDTYFSIGYMPREEGQDKEKDAKVDPEAVRAVIKGIGKILLGRMTLLLIAKYRHLPN